MKCTPHDHRSDTPLPKSSSIVAFPRSFPPAFFRSAFARPTMGTPTVVAARDGRHSDRLAGCQACGRSSLAPRKARSQFGVARALSKTPLTNRLTSTRPAFSVSALVFLWRCSFRNLFHPASPAARLQFFNSRRAQSVPSGPCVI